VHGAELIEANRLIRAVRGLPGSESPSPAGVPRDIWLSLARGVVERWAVEFKRDLVIAVRVLRRADSEDGEEARTRRIEEALWRIAAAREKLGAVFVLSFGVPALQPYGRSVRFNATSRSTVTAARRRLNELAREHAAAVKLRRVVPELDRHPAIQLRHELSHGLAPIGGVNFTTHVIVARTRGSSVLDHELVSLFPEGPELDSWTPADLQARAVKKSWEALELLREMAGHLAHLVGTAGEIDHAQVVYVDEETKRVSMVRPSE
jgi:hypothetical protein